jgi:hypothetical protein
MLDMVLVGCEVYHSKLSPCFYCRFMFFLCQVLPGESFPRMTGAKGPKASEDTDAAAAAEEQTTPVDDTDPRLGNVYFHL